MNRAKAFIIAVTCILLVGCNGLQVNVVGLPTSPGASRQQAGSPADTVTTLPAGASAPENIMTETPVPATTPSPETMQSAGPAQEPSPTVVNIMAVGDIMFHKKQVEHAYNPKTKSYDFDYSFKYIKDIISSADLAVGNFECTLGGPNRPYSQSMSFSAPDSAADALKKAGFDILSTANNHTNDRGRDGLVRTVEVMREKGLVCVGTRKDASEKPYYIADVKGIKIGFTGFSFGSSNSDLLNVYSTSNLTKMKQVAKDMRTDGAEIVVFIIHWGSEYQRKPGSSQLKIAKALADSGVDIIFGSHPHVLQTVDTITSDKTGKKTFVAYSDGNFISNQVTRWNATKFMYTEDGVILNVKIEKKADGSPAAVSSVEYLPTKTMMYIESGKQRYAVLPIQKALQSPKDFDMSSYEIKKAKKTLVDTNSLLADAVADGDISVMKQK